MTEATRIACPGCRASLLYKPEALDFPANCSACDCRFSVGLYVRVSCPKCRQGSKVRESYRGRQVRCLRCRHDFLAEQGIPPGAGGLILVARMLDDPSPTPPETAQPFVGSAREDFDRRPASPEPPRALDVGAPTVSGSGVWEISRALELERLKAEIAELRCRHQRELASSRKAAQQADDRWSTTEGKLVEAMLELGEAEQRTARLLADRDDELDAARLERSALLSRLDRLNAAVHSATLGASEAEALAEEALRKFDAAADDLGFEQRRRVELVQILEEAETARREADRAASSLRDENRRLTADLGKVRAEAASLLKQNEHLAEIVERLLGENQSLGEEADQLRAENRRMTDEVGLSRRTYREHGGTGERGAMAAAPPENSGSNV